MAEHPAEHASGELDASERDHDVTGRDKRKKSEKVERTLDEAKRRIIEDKKTAERLSSLTLRLSQRLSSSPLSSVNKEPKTFNVWTCAECHKRIDGSKQYELHIALHPNHHPQVSASKATANGLPTIDDVRRLLCLRPQDRAIYFARFQSLTEKVQDGTATSNEEKEFFALRREFIG